MFRKLKNIARIRHVFLLSSVFVLSAAVSCSTLPPPPAGPQFSNIYDAWKAGQGGGKSVTSYVLVNCSFREAPLLDVLRFLSSYGVSVVCEESLDKSTVSLECKGQTVGDVLSYLAKRFATQITSDGRFFYLGKVNSTDKGVFVSAVSRMKDDEWSKMINVLISPDGRANVTDGVLVVSDYGTVLQRVARTVADIQAADIGCFVVQLWVLTKENNNQDELGFDTVPSGELSAVLASAGNSSAYSFSLASRLNYVLSHKKDDLSCNALFVINDGSEGSIIRGVKVPIAKKNVSSYGTVQTSGWDFVQTGLQLKAAARSMAADRCRVTLTVSNSTIQQYVGDAPQTLEQSLTCSPIVRSGDVYLAGQMDTVTRSRTRYLLGQASEGITGAVQVWLRVYRISDTAGAVRTVQCVGGAEGGTPSGGRTDGAPVTGPAPASAVSAPVPTSPPSKANDAPASCIAPIYSPVLVSVPSSGAASAHSAP